MALVLGEGKFQIAENEDLFPGSFYIRVGVYSWPLESAISWGALGRVATSYPPLTSFLFSFFFPKSSDFVLFAFW